MGPRNRPPRGERVGGWAPFWGAPRAGLLVRRTERRQRTCCRRFRFFWGTPRPLQRTSVRPAFHAPVGHLPWKCVAPPVAAPALQAPPGYFSSRPLQRTTHFHPTGLPRPCRASPVEVRSASRRRTGPPGPCTALFLPSPLTHFHPTGFPRPCRAPSVEVRSASRRRTCPPALCTALFLPPPPTHFHPTGFLRPCREPPVEVRSASRRRTWQQAFFSEPLSSSSEKIVL